ncbi:MAG: VanZ family protein [Deltaproteobacteria bacterium]|nr:VanZ family protein [Candidatus Anaeroferrophillus wilburensis]MBN2889495.1 VanZ family protein [Deltaproteobacteria bacterium]
MSFRNGAGSLVCFYLLPLVGYGALIYYFSAQSDLDLGVSFSHFDKLLHLLEYAVLGVLGYRFWRRLLPARSPAFLLLLAFLLALVYGISDEFHQSLVPGRDSSPMDILADGAGGYLGARIYMVICQRREG